jgi:hypothetical protein
LYVEVFSIALEELAKRDKVSGDEDAISETLSLILSRVCFHFGESRNLEVQTPAWEDPIPPLREDELKGGKSKKRPDFTCKWVNPWANSHEEHEISFHVECKRLGFPTSPSWNLNKNYVVNGIQRFDCFTHEYGKRAFSGMMIGYVISMTPREIEAEVNGCQNKYLPDFENIDFKFDTKNPYQAQQKIARRKVIPVKFELIHLWIDLRNNYQN